MIVEIAQKENETFCHSGKNVTEYGNHFDGERFYFFESDDEKVLFFNPDTTAKQLKQITKKNKPMQTHENTNVQKPTVILKKPFFKAKKYRLNILDFIKGFIIASLSGAIFVIQKYADSGTLDVNNLKPVYMAFIAGGAGYLIKNFFTDSSKK